MIDADQAARIITMLAPGSGVVVDPDVRETAMVALHDHFKSDESAHIPKWFKQYMSRRPKPVPIDDEIRKAGVAEAMALMFGIRNARSL